MERIIPVICKVDRKGLDYTSVGGWLKKVGEEFVEVLSAATEWSYKDTANARKHLCYELMDLITVCISFLHWLGCDDKMIDELIMFTNEKNGGRGYHEK